MKKIAAVYVVITILNIMTACKSVNYIPYESRADISYAIRSEGELGGR